jgi:HK97 family phage portal protein
MASWWRNLLGLERALPEGMSLNGGIAIAATPFRGAPRRGTRELMVAYREQPWLRAVAGRIARGVAGVEWEVYVRVEEPSTERKASSRFRSVPKGVSAEGRVRDVAGVPSFRWGRDFAVRDVRLQSGSIRQRAARRRELADQGLLREVVDHPLLDLLAFPNSQLTGRSSLQMTQTWVDLKGEAFWMLEARNGVPTRYLPLPPHWVTQVPSDASQNFRVSFQSLNFEVPANQMVWLRDPDPENPYGRGTGVAEALGDELETDEYAAKYVKNWFFNNGMPSAIVAFEGADAAAVKRAEEKWGQTHGGIANANRVHFAGGKMNAQKLDSSFKEQEIGPLRKGQRDTVAQVFGVPPEIIGIIENSNRSTIDAAAYIYAIGVEFPRVQFLRSELQSKLVPYFDETLCLEAELDIPDDAERRLSVMRAMPGVFSLNEWRVEGGREPLERFDDQFPPLAMPGQNPASGTEEKPSNEKPVEKPDEDELDEGEVEKSLGAGDPPWVSELKR